MAGEKGFVIESLNPADLQAHPQNFRRHPAAQQEALAESLAEHGWLAAPIFNRRTGHLLDGHARIEWAVRQGSASIPVRVIDVPAAQEKRILASFDRIGALAEPDEAGLAELLRELQMSEAGLPAGWSDSDLQELLLAAGASAFEPVGEDEQGLLDRKSQVTCPECGHQFAPA